MSHDGHAVTKGKLGLQTLQLLKNNVIPIGSGLLLI